MPATTLVNQGIKYNAPYLETLWHVWNNENWLLLDSVINLRVISRTLNTPPGSPANGDRYLVAAGGTGAWTGHDGKLALYNVTAWVFFVLPNGTVMTSVADTGKLYVKQAGAFVDFTTTALAAMTDTSITTPVVHEGLFHNGTVWVNRLPRLELASWYDGKPAVNQVGIRLVAARAFTLPQNLTGSQGKAGAAATASATFSVKKNGTEVGTFNFAASATTATFTMASATSFAAGDVLTVTAPASQDATLADIGFILLTS